MTYAVFRDGDRISRPFQIREVGDVAINDSKQRDDTIK
jgi:hypothetical protein